MDHSLIGTIQSCKVSKKITNGFIVKYNDTEILLPDEAVHEEIDLDQSIKVFLYTNKKGQAVASMTIPEVTRNSYGWAEVEEVVTNMGVFVNIGLEDKEILVSTDDLPLLKSVWPVKGDFLFVSLELDKKGRLLAEPITEQEVWDDLEPAPASILNTETQGRVYRSTKAGSSVLTEEGYRGFIHPNERKEEPRLGETVIARVIDVKEDGSINLSLRPVKKESRKEDADVILDYLKENDGIVYLDDNSDPEKIREIFQISKSAFKRAVGKLMKENQVEQKNGATKLLHSSD
ncbi:MAG: S1-like domain-containing RNA-binding protein [Halobacillus sp.]|uniref:CvfB family protein n=1 Tax=Halobacillus sp. TaxID=56800 RepID=UPI003BB1112F